VNIHALHNRGISFERLARYKEAVKDFSSVIEIDQQNANAYFNRGCCYDSIGELDLAISDYSVALELDLRSGNENGQSSNNNNIEISDVKIPRNMEAEDSTVALEQEESNIPTDPQVENGISNTMRNNL
jgi:tetratricopeptide (TPR) repeat protein